MSLIIDGTAISTGKAIKYCPGGYLLGDTIEKVIYDGITVWQLQRDFTATNPSGFPAGTSVSGAWTGELRLSSNQGTSRYITISGIDLTPYKRITSHVSFWRIGNAVGGYSDLQATIRCAGRASNTLYCSSGGNSNSGTITCDVSAVTGVTAVTLAIDFYTVEQNGHGGYTVYNFGFLSS